MTMEAYGYEYSTEYRTQNDCHWCLLPILRLEYKGINMVGGLLSGKQYICSKNLVLTSIIHYIKTETKPVSSGLH